MLRYWMVSASIYVLLDLTTINTTINSSSTTSTAHYFYWERLRDREFGHKYLSLKGVSSFTSLH